MFGDVENLTVLVVDFDFGDCLACFSSAEISS